MTDLKSDDYPVGGGVGAVGRVMSDNTLKDVID